MEDRPVDIRIWERGKVRCLLAIKLQFYKIIRKYGGILHTCSELTTQQTVCVYDTIRKYEIGGPELEGDVGASVGKGTAIPLSLSISSVCHRWQCELSQDEHPWLCGEDSHHLSSELGLLFLLLIHTKRKALEITITSCQPAIESCNVEVFSKMGSSSLIWFRWRKWIIISTLYLMILLEFYY